MESPGTKEDQTLLSSNWTQVPQIANGNASLPGSFYPRTPSGSLGKRYTQIMYKPKTYSMVTLNYSITKV